MGYRWLFLLQYGESDAADFEASQDGTGRLSARPSPTLNYGLITHNTRLAVLQRGYALFMKYHLSVQLEPLNHVILDRFAGTGDTIYTQSPESLRAILPTVTTG